MGWIEPGLAANRLSWIQAEAIEALAPDTPGRGPLLDIHHEVRLRCHHLWQMPHRAPPAVEHLGLLLLALDRFAAAPAASRRCMVSLLEWTLHRQPLIDVFRRIDQTLSFQVALEPAVDWILSECPEWAVDLQDLTRPTVQRVLSHMGPLPPTLLNADVLVAGEIERRWHRRKPEAEERLPLRLSVRGDGGRCAGVPLDPLSPRRSTVRRGESAGSASTARSSASCATPWMA